MTTSTNTPEGEISIRDGKIIVTGAARDRLHDRMTRTLKRLGWVQRHWGMEAQLSEPVNVAAAMKLLKRADPFTASVDMFERLARAAKMPLDELLRDPPPSYPTSGGEVCESAPVG